MSAAMPELGSKISLISKADIRYEGRLFTVDPKECTIALASVRSYGTEDRETIYPVSAQSQVYDYILFRGSDIKDIRVVTSPPQPTHLNDPAIMQLSAQPTPFQPHHPILQMGVGGVAGSHPMGGINMPNNVPTNSMYGMGTAPVITNVTGGSSMQLPPQPVSSVPASASAALTDLIGGGTRSTTPASLISSRKSPTSDQAVQTGGVSQTRSSGVNPQDNRRNVKPIQPPNNQRTQYQNTNTNRNQSRRPPMDSYSYNNNSRSQQPYSNSQTRRYQQQSHAQQNQQSNQTQSKPPQQLRSGPWNQSNNMRMNQQQTRNRDQRMQVNGPRPRSSNTQHTNVPYNNHRPSSGLNHQSTGAPPLNAANKKTLKFDNDYDFEQANTQFEELRSKLAKVKVGDESVGVQQDDLQASANDGANVSNNSANKSNSSNHELIPNGDGDKKDDSGDETAAGDIERDIEDSGLSLEGGFYDKTKSFFDKISCEAIERAKGKMHRVDWKAERKLNSETFGVSSTRRGNYRSRGGYRTGMGYNRPATYGGSGGGGNNMASGGGVVGGGGYHRNMTGGYRPMQRRDNHHQNRNSGGNRNSSTGSGNTNRQSGGFSSGMQQSQQPITVGDAAASK